LAEKIFTRTKGSGAECLSKKGGAGFAVGIAIRDVIHAIALDQNRILPVSTVQDGGCYGIRDVAISVPTVVGRPGAVQRIEIELWPKELQGLRASAAAIKPTLDTVMKRVG
jgi:L-lactate dehydrogenase